MVVTVHVVISSHFCSKEYFALDHKTAYSADAKSKSYINSNISNEHIPFTLLYHCCCVSYVLLNL